VDRWGIVLALGVLTLIGVGEASDHVVYAQTDKNPLDININTIKRGRQLYSLHCVTCHGKDGRGDTEMREFLKTPPSDLTDDQWNYGGHDSMLFNVIHSGREERDMPAFREKLTKERTWYVISYLRYLGGDRP
jgi:cbb3-type cytochrome c oxidase subunit III